QLASGSPLSPVSVPFLCLLHPGMQGSLTVIPDSQTASDPAVIGNLATSTSSQQYLQDTQGAEAAENEAYKDAGPGEVIAGTAAPHVEVTEMFPEEGAAKAGQSIK